MKKGLVILFVFFGMYATSQQDSLIYLDSNLIQLSGVVIDEESLDPMPYTTVFDRSIRRGVIADFYGFFSTPVYP